MTVRRFTAQCLSPLRNKRNSTGDCQTAEFQTGRCRRWVRLCPGAMSELPPQADLRTSSLAGLKSANRRHSAIHSITSSARASIVGGTVRPNAFAVVRLMTRSNLVGCSTGRSAGFAPRRILSTYSAARR
jgi:hypothetical protein